MKVRPSVASMQPYVPGELKPGAVKLASNENPFGPSPEAIATIRRDAASVHLYPDQHAHRLRQKLAQKYSVNENQLLIGNGSDEIMTMIAGTYLQHGSTALTSAGTFSTYAFAALLFGGHMKTVPPSEGRFDLVRIAAAVDDSTDLIFVCNPNNPTGTYVSHDELAQFLGRIPEHVLVVIDEAYAEFVTAGDFPRSVELLAEFENLVILRTFSKIYGLAGLRVGYAIGREQVISDLGRVKLPFNVSLIAQAAAASAIDDREFVRASISNNDTGRDYLYAELDRLGLPYYHTQANFICFDSGFDAARIFHRIMELGVTIRPLTSFGMPTSIRVTIGTPEQNRLFVKCLETALDELRTGS
ncbi:MAG TPA: histidinol-phosphate transaminase [Spirochaetia bacterium]|nr:histidinol-phosphate transaminase [Spirochaetia bacterium]